MKSYLAALTSDKKLLAPFFQRNPALYAYHLGDLDPFFFANTRWWRIAKHGGSTEAVALLYSAFETPVILALTDNDAQGELWRRIMIDLPPNTHAHYRIRHKSIIEDHYQIQEIGTHYKMRWQRNSAACQARGTGQAGVVTLTPGDRGQINALHRRAYPESYFDTRLLETGYCVGVFDDSGAEKKLVSVAACHVFSKEYGVASLGAVTTDPDYRGRGFGTAVTLALVNKLEPDIDCICLNVHSQNAAAIRIYEHLGFIRRHDYEEGLLRMRD